MVNLESMTLQELIELQKRLPTLIAQRKEEVRSDVLQKATQLAAKHGLTLDELVSKGRKRHAPRYANPVDTSQTWTGVGSRPKWVREWITSGRELEELLINKET